jgi:hypothetical protein
MVFSRVKLKIFEREKNTFVVILFAMNLAFNPRLSSEKPLPEIRCFLTRTLRHTQDVGVLYQFLCEGRS